MILTTFSGKTGDILWALPAVREISRAAAMPVDLCIMPMYASLLPLLNLQSYIRTAFVFPLWGDMYTGSPFGDQPWKAPVEELPNFKDYSRVVHLTYREHPRTHLALATLATGGLSYPKAMFPFIELPPKGPPEWGKAVAVAFNADYGDQKKEFVHQLQGRCTRWTGAHFMNVSGLPWVTAAERIRSASFFLGCRSANYVLAHGLQTRVLVYEPNAARRDAMWGPPPNLGAAEEVVPDVRDFESFVRVASTWLA